MTRINDVPQGVLVEKSAEKLKSVKEIVIPAWAPFVKTSVARERAPIETDWWYTRSASVLLKLYRYSPIGVSKLKTYYGGKKNRGVKPEKVYKASGNILRKILQQLEKSGLAKQVKIGVHKGRSITQEGKKLLDSVAVEIAPKKKTEAPKPQPAKVEVKEQKQVKKEEKKAEDKKQEKKEVKTEKVSEKKDSKEVKKIKKSE